MRENQDDPLLSVIVPAYNEAGTIVQLLEQVVAVELDLLVEILVVDDGSTDDSAARVERWAEQFAGNERITVRLLRKSNGGKGSAVRAGIDASRGDYIIIQDADLEYEPNDYPEILAPLRSGQAEVVYGSRILGPSARGSLSYYLGGRLVTLATNIIYGARLTDEPTCYKAFKGDLLRAIPLASKGFEFCPEVTAKVLRLGIPILEVPIHYHPRSHEEGKKIRAKDGLVAIMELLKWRFSRITLKRNDKAHAIRSSSIQESGQQQA